MKTAYKLTNADMRAYNGFQWTLNRTMTTSGVGPICGPGWIHTYADPLLAVLLNPIHANIKRLRLFRVEASGQSYQDYGLKAGYTSVRLIEELPVPVVSTATRVRFGLYCALTVSCHKKFVHWATRWLSGIDRNEEAAAAESQAGAVRAAWEAWSAAWAARMEAEARTEKAQAAWAERAAFWAAKAAAEAASAHRPLIIFAHAAVAHAKEDNDI